MALKLSVLLAIQNAPPVDGFVGAPFLHRLVAFVSVGYRWPSTISQGTSSASSTEKILAPEVKNPRLSV